jgi:hypothetical protein
MVGGFGMVGEGYSIIELLTMRKGVVYHVYIYYDSPAKRSFSKT